MTQATALAHILLTPEEMGKADQYAVQHGTPGYTLMLAAGERILEYMLRTHPLAKTIGVLCGPGNNGGDGFVVAKRLRSLGKTVHVGLLGDPSKLKGDAAKAFSDWPGKITPLEAFPFDNCDLLIDALFGAGLSRGLEGTPAELVGRMNAASAPIIAVDLPSGLSGRTGKAEGAVVQATASVTFFRKKPGHLLLPGRELCGDVIVGDIGIPQTALTQLEAQLHENHPDLWRAEFPSPSLTGHKYSKGHALILSGPEFTTGASRLTAKAALRTGAGLISLCGTADALRIHAAHVTAIMLRHAETASDLKDLLDDARLTTLALGPGLGTSTDAEEKLTVALKADRKLILDADALTLLSQRGDASFAALKALNEPAILTPHAGEFKRLFGDLSETSKVEQAREAARQSGAIIVYKGADTVIAAPDGRAVINTNAPPWLATAGSGDTLTGIITGLRSQDMPAFEAACAGVWLHGEAANVLGPGLTADDLDEGLKIVLKERIGGSGET